MGEGASAGRARRVSITKLQRESAAGAELLALCETITEDGHLEPEEIATLQQWLVANLDTDLPAHDFLRRTVERIVDDGVVTEEERQELHEALEAILPTDARTIARRKRKAREKAEKDRAKVERREKAEAEKRRTRPLDIWDFMVAGVSYEGRELVVGRYASPGDRAFLLRDRANIYSRNAVEVRLENGMMVGYVPEKFAVDVAPFLDAGHPHAARIKRILTGGRIPIPVVLAHVYPTDAIRSDLVFEHQVPAPQQAPAPPPQVRLSHPDFPTEVLLGSGAQEVLSSVWNAAVARGSTFAPGAGLAVDALVIRDEQDDQGTRVEVDGSPIGHLTPVDSAGFRIVFDEQVQACRAVVCRVREEPSYFGALLDLRIYPDQQKAAPPATPPPPAPRPPAPRTGQVRGPSPPQAPPRRSTPPRLLPRPMQQPQRKAGCIGILCIGVSLLGLALAMATALR